LALHCPECGFVNPEGANYCQKCGAYLGGVEGEDASTMAYKVSETLLGKVAIYARVMDGCAELERRSD